MSKQHQPETQVWPIEVSWEMLGTMYVRADTYDNACNMVEKGLDRGVLSLPEGSYVQASFRVERSDEEE